MFCDKDSGEYIITDVKQKRIFIYDASGIEVCNFAHVHQHSLLPGITMTQCGQLVIPFNTGSNVCLHYYSLGGQFKGTAYLKPDVEVGGLTISAEGDTLLTDKKNACIYTISNTTKTIKNTIKLEKEVSEKHTPVPCGITVNS